MSIRLSHHSPAARRLSRVLALAVLVLAACGGGGQALVTSTQGPQPATQATLVLDGTPLVFKPSACSAEPISFAATGTGRMGDRPFVVTVRAPNIFVVKFGVDDELEDPPKGERWLYGLNDTKLHSDGHMISGSARLADVRALDLPVVTARIDLTCE